jgi:SNF family Na+-dependent transporter
MLSALLMLRRLATALRFALREDFGRILAAALALVAVGTVTFTLGAGGASSTASTSRSPPDDLEHPSTPS